MEDAWVNVGGMDDELPRAKPDDTLAALVVQDLDRLSIAELDDRIAALEVEITRIRAKRDSAATLRSAADSLFRQ